MNLFIFRGSSRITTDPIMGQSTSFFMSADNRSFAIHLERIYWRRKQDNATALNPISRQRAYLVPQWESFLMIAQKWWVYWQCHLIIGCTTSSSVKTTSKWQCIDSTHMSIPNKRLSYVVSNLWYLYNLLCSSHSAIFAGGEHMKAGKCNRTHHDHDHPRFRFLPASIWGGMHPYHHAITD